MQASVDPCAVLCAYGETVIGRKMGLLRCRQPKAAFAHLLRYGPGAWSGRGLCKTLFCKGWSSACRLSLKAACLSCGTVLQTVAPEKRPCNGHQIDYTLAALQDMDGQQLVLATHPILISLGIVSKLQRMQLLNRRDELLLEEDDQKGPQRDGAHVSQTPSSRRPGCIVTTCIVTGGLQSSRSRRSAKAKHDKSVCVVLR